MSSSASKGASRTEIRPRKLAASTPGHEPGNKEAEEMFKEVNEANEVLSDPEKKARYDQFGFAGALTFNYGAGAGGPGAGGFNGGFDFNVLGDLFGGFFGGGFGGTAQRRTAAPSRARASAPPFPSRFWKPPSAVKGSDSGTETGGMLRLSQQAAAPPAPPEVVPPAAAQLFVQVRRRPCRVCLLVPAASKCGQDHSPALSTPSRAAAG